MFSARTALTASTLPKLGQPARDGDDLAMAPRERKTDPPLEIAELCVSRLTTALRDACPDLVEPDDASFAMRAHGETHRPAKTRALAEALEIAIPCRNELRDPMWQLRRKVATSTIDLLDEVTKWVALAAPLVDYNLEREAKYGAPAQLFPASLIPSFVVVAHSTLGCVARLTSIQLMNPDTHSRGRPPDHVVNDVTRILDGAGFSVYEITGITEKVNDGPARKRVGNRLNEMKRTEKRRAGKRGDLSARAGSPGR